MRFALELSGRRLRIGVRRRDLLRPIQHLARRFLRMTHRSSLVDWVLVRAWIEPDHTKPLRVVIRRPNADADEPESEQVFADADGAASFLRLWLTGLTRRWDAGERSRLSRGRRGDHEPGDEPES